MDAAGLDALLPDVDDPLLRQWKADGMQLKHADQWYERVNAMIERAIYYRRNLARTLHYEHGLTYGQYAEVINANLSSRQAARAQWKRDIDANRRPAGAPGRGGWPKGRKRKPDAS
jgi:hypothetical protein